MQWFSLVQGLGYLACILGVAAFLQKKDTRLKALLAVESAVYAVHFWLLGSPSSSLSAFLSGCRSGLAIKYRHWLLALVFIALNLGLGLPYVHRWSDLLPVIGSVLGTVAVLTMTGLPMRTVLLSSTLCWLANNWITGSVGGVVLESFNALANGFTLSRMLAKPARPPESAAP